MVRMVLADVALGLEMTAMVHQVGPQAQATETGYQDPRQCIPPGISLKVIGLFNFKCIMMVAILMYKQS